MKRYMCIARSLQVVWKIWDIPKNLLPKCLGAKNKFSLPFDGRNYSVQFCAAITLSNFVLARIELLNFLIRYTRQIYANPC